MKYRHRIISALVALATGVMLLATVAEISSGTFSLFFQNCSNIKRSSLPFGGSFRAVELVYPIEPELSCKRCPGDTMLGSRRKSRQGSLVRGAATRSDAKNSKHRLEQARQSGTRNITGLGASHLTLKPTYKGVWSQPPITTFVASSPDQTRERLAYREMFAAQNAEALNVHVIFVLGLAQTFNTQMLVEAEGRTFGDILQVKVSDSYENLSWKIYFMMNWAGKHCANDSFVLKADIDTLLVLKNLRRFVDAHANYTNTIFGRCWDNTAPYRNCKEKWYTPVDSYSDNVFPRYCSGTAYLMTRDVPSMLFQAVASLNTYLGIEDVLFTGIAAKYSTVRRVRVKEFNPHARDNAKPSCDRISSHMNIPPGATIDQLWKNFLEHCKPA